MRLHIEETSGLQIETTNGTYFVPDESCTDKEYALQFAECFDVEDVEEVSIVSGFFWRFTLPGYTDCTEWGYAETLLEALRDVAGMYDSAEDFEQIAGYIDGFEEFRDGVLLCLAFTSSVETEEEITGDIPKVVDPEDVWKLLSEEEKAEVTSDCVCFLLEALPYLEGQDCELVATEDEEGDITSAYLMH